MSLHSIMVVRFSPDKGVNYFQTWGGIHVSLRVVMDQHGR